MLASSRERRKTGRCVLEGEHIVAVYADRLGVPETVIVDEGALRRPGIASIVQRLPSAGTLVLPAPLFAATLAVPAGVGIVAVVPTPRATPASRPRLAVVLEDVQDPGNVGSILRSAAAAGAEQAVLSRDCAFAWSPKVLRAGQGAHFHLAIAENVDLAQWCCVFAGCGGNVVGAVVGGGVPLFDAELHEPLALLIGNEGAGLSWQLQAALTMRVTIPMPGGMESLNAAAAAAVCLFETVRQLPLRATADPQQPSQ